MTRDSLRPLEGQLVWFCGRLDTWRPMADGQLTACLVAVTIRPWDGEAAVKDCPVAVVLDHTWIGNIPTTQPRERLLSYEGMARVGWYRRSDGSVDLGLQKVPALELCDAAWKHLTVSKINVSAGSFWIRSLLSCRRPCSGLHERRNAS